MTPANQRRTASALTNGIAGVGGKYNTVGGVGTSRRGSSSHGDLLALDKTTTTIAPRSRDNSSQHLSSMLSLPNQCQYRSNSTMAIVVTEEPEYGGCGDGNVASSTFSPLLPSIRTPSGRSSSNSKEHGEGGENGFEENDEEGNNIYGLYNNNSSRRKKKEGYAVQKQLSPKRKKQSATNCEKKFVRN